MPLIVCEVGEDGSTVFRVSDTRTSTRSSGSSSLGSSPSKKRKSTEPMELEEHFRASTSTEAAKKWEHISESERGLVMSIMNSKIDLIQPQTRERVKTLFIQLDTNKSGILTVEDFKGVNPDLDEKLQAIWQGLRINFDFDNNSVITQQEFQYKDELVRKTIMLTQQDVDGIKVDVQEIKESLNKIEDRLYEAR